jgi:DNA-binding transcriptional LysR family regulator
VLPAGAARHRRERRGAADHSRLAVRAARVISGFPAVDLFTDRWVFLVARDNPEVGDQLTMADLATLPWAAYQHASDALAARQLTMIGVEPRETAPPAPGPLRD